MHGYGRTGTSSMVLNLAGASLQDFHIFINAFATAMICVRVHPYMYSWKSSCVFDGFEKSRPSQIQGVVQDVLKALLTHLVD